MFSLWNSPSKGHIDFSDIILIDVKKALYSENYSLRIGTDSQRIGFGKYNFISAIVIHNIGKGANYYYSKDVVNHKSNMELFYRMTLEASKTMELLNLIENYFEDFDKNKLFIDLDVGRYGKSKCAVNSVVGMFKGLGYNLSIKPQTIASRVADKHCR